MTMAVILKAKCERDIQIYINTRLLLTQSVLVLKTRLGVHD
jgi:hypothetical protein